MPVGDEPLDTNAMCCSLLPQEMLACIKEKGPYTKGIFRKSANKRSCRILKKKLNTGEKLNLHNESVLVIACVLKVGNILALSTCSVTEATQLAAFTTTPREPNLHHRIRPDELENTTPIKI